jgi:uncharacterized delta-60 repeat protein
MMGKSYRFRATPGKDKNIRMNIDQDFDFIEILSLKLKQGDVYNRFCADYGVVTGRVIANGGYGVPNVSISVFVPLTTEDENDIVISTLYPYKRVDQKNEDGYRYNLLPYTQEYGGHTPTGTFPDRDDILTRQEVLEVYEKYYKYTVRTNESGDFMIVGVPLGIQTVMMDMDMSNIGCFSQRPSDLVRMGIGVESQFAGTQFRSSTDIDSLPQIVNSKKDVDVASFWGEGDICNVGITRVDFDLRDLGIIIEPQSIFMGSLFSTTEEDSLGIDCKPKFDSGNLCDLVTGPAKILTIRQTIKSDGAGYPILEQYNLPEGGNVVDDNGAWLVELPMNLDYVITNEFGEQVLSSDPGVGIPTRAKYRFRVVYQNEDAGNSDTIRPDYLIPNIKEYGWDLSLDQEPSDYDLQKRSYAFSLDWNDYGDTATTIGNQIIQEAINCEDKFFEFNYNRVYTVSSFIDRWKWGYNRSRHLGIKEITDRACTTTTNRFPVNDGVRNFDNLFFIFNLILTVFTVVFPIIIILWHFVARFYPLIRRILNIIFVVVLSIIRVLCLGVNWLRRQFGLREFDCPRVDAIQLEDRTFPRLFLPMMSYPDCEACSCENYDMERDLDDPIYAVDRVNYSPLIDSNSVGEYTWTEQFEYNKIVSEAYCGTFNTCELDDTSFYYGINQGFAGYSGPYTKFSKTNINAWPKQDSRIGSVGFTPHWSQSLNKLNSRGSYFEGGNIIKTTVKNINPQTGLEDPSTQFTDLPLILVCDEGTLEQLGGAGTLLTFTDLNTINDPNLTGGTQNQFNTFSVTGTAINNQNALVTVNKSYIKPDVTIGTAQLKLRLTEQSKDYKFKAGVEYFQIITGGTMSQIESMGDIYSQYGALRNFIFENGIKFRWGKGYLTPGVFGGKFDDVVNGIVIDSNNDIVVGGNFNKYILNSSTFSNGIIKLNQADGTINTTFGTGIGVGYQNGFISDTKVYTTTKQVDGKILVGGDFYIYNGVSNMGGIARLDGTNGTIDTTFKANTGSGFLSYNADKVQIIKIQTDGKIIVGGQFTQFNGINRPNGLARLNTDGTYDTAFGNNLGGVGGGVIVNGTVYAIDILSDGRIVVGGLFSSFNGNSNYRNIVLLNSNGTIDTSFDVTTLVPGEPNGFSQAVYTLKVDANDNILVGGKMTKFRGDGTYQKLVRITPTGVVDPTFNIFPDLLNYLQNYLNSAEIKTIEIDSNGKILLGGVFSVLDRTNILRINNDGSVDPTFDAGNDWGSSVNVITENPNGGYYVGGNFAITNINGGSINNFAKINLNGDFSTSSTLLTADPLSTWKNVAQGYNAYPKFFFDNFNNKQIIILSRGVDPYTEKQTIEYDLSTIFGLTDNTVKVKGEYYLNIPIQPNFVQSQQAGTPSTTNLGWQEPGISNSQWYGGGTTPESHDVINNSNPFLYHRPFNTFTITSASWTAFTNNSLKYYNSTDRSRTSHVAFNNDVYNIGNFTSFNGRESLISYPWIDGSNAIGIQWTQGDPPDIITTNYYIDTANGNPVYKQGNIEGASFLASTVNPGDAVDLENSGTFVRIFSPSYHLDNLTDTVMTNNQRLVFRSDRLPTSTSTEVNGNTSYSLFLNDNFAIYSVSDQGQIQQIQYQINQVTDTTNNLQDFTGDTQSNLNDAVINTLTCEGLKPLGCYVGEGETFTVQNPCGINEDAAITGSISRQRVIGGCYYFVQEPFFKYSSIEKDIQFFAEWKARFRFTYGACRGVISHVFQNNWVNGALYMFSIKKQTIFDIQGNPTLRRHCGSQDNLTNRGQGPIYYDDTTNSFFYRSTPYSTNNGFIGQKPKYLDFTTQNWIDAEPKFKGMNDRNTHFPTTLMDLGPRDQFAKEICFNPELEGYLIETMKTTSYNDTSDILLFFILSRLLSSSNTQRLLGSGDASINTIFSRSENRVDGDLAQMFSINSEYGIVPFSDQFYDDNDIFLSSTGNALIGIIYSANTINRILLTPGINTFGNVQQLIPYPVTQEVPMYRWRKVDPQATTPSNPQPPATIFGSELNDWNTQLQTTNNLYSTKYQTMSFNGTPYFQATNGANTGYIYNYDSNGNPTTSPSQNQTTDSFVVGAPYHFYFGLSKGKSAINRYISKYIVGK